jgi:hypothetical protein
LRGKCQSLIIVYNVRNFHNICNSDIRDYNAI